MKCINPVIGWITGDTVCKSDGVKSLKVEFSFNRALKYYNGVPTLLDQNEIAFPCGKCPACLVQKRKDMSVRLSHEATMYDKSCFLTLTYDTSKMPLDSFGRPSLDKSHVQKFLKRLRAFLSRKTRYGKIRFFAVGEYGSKTHRPHYHILVFGWFPDDAYPFCVRGENTLFRSPVLESLWTFGISSVGKVTSNSCKYCAKYVTKKLVSISDFVPPVDEFFLCSKRNGGIGAPWLDLYWDNLENGLLNVKGCNGSFSIPRYYLQRFRKTHLDKWLQLRDKKIKYLQNTPLTPVSINVKLRNIKFNEYQISQEVARETL